MQEIGNMQQQQMQQQQQQQMQNQQMHPEMQQYPVPTGQFQSHPQVGR